MIPTIEQIVSDVVHGLCSRAQAIEWLHKHVELAEKRVDLSDLRDMFAGQAISTFSWRLGHQTTTWQANAAACFEIADAMLKARSA